MSNCGTVLPIHSLDRGSAAGGPVYTGHREARCRAGMVGLLPVGRGPTPVKVKEGEPTGRGARALLLLLCCVFVCLWV